MCLWAIVPVKPLRRGKSRLSNVLSVEERERLNYEMLERTLSTLQSVAEIEQILVVSRDTAALALAREHQARTLQEKGDTELNMALQRATVVPKAYAACGVLILPADLPLITPEDVRTFLHQGGDPPEIVIAPDRFGTGTNALLISPIGLIEYSFGPSSFRAHIQQAKAASARVSVCKLDNLALDIDLPEDLDVLKKLQSSNEFSSTYSR